MSRYAGKSTRAAWALAGMMAVLAWPAGDAAAQQYYKGITRAQCSRLGGTQFAATGRLVPNPQDEIGECYVPPKSGSLGSGRRPAPSRSGEALINFSNAVGSMLDAMTRSNNYRQANDYNQMGMQAAASGMCDTAIMEFDRALDYLRANGDAQNATIVSRNQELARECVRLKEASEQRRRDAESAAARQADDQARSAIANPWADDGKPMEAGKCYGDCTLADDVRASAYHREALGRQPAQVDDSNPFLDRAPPSARAPDGSRSNVSGRSDPGGHRNPWCGPGECAGSAR